MTIKRKRKCQDMKKNETRAVVGKQKRGGFLWEWGTLLYLLCVNTSLGHMRESSERRVANGVAGFMSILVFYLPRIEAKIVLRHSSSKFRIKMNVC